MLPGNISLKPTEAVAAWANRTDADPVPVRQVRGGLRLAPGHYKYFDVAAVEAAVPAPLVADLAAGYAARLQAFGWLRAFSSARVVVDFLDAQGAPVAFDAAVSATLTPYRRFGDGLVKGPELAFAGQRLELADEAIIGRPTLYVISALALGPATTLRVHVAGEGLGLRRNLVQ